MVADAPSRDGLAAWRAFLEAHAAVTRVLEDELVAERALPLPWYDVLVQLSEAPGGRLRMQELARRVLLSKSGLTRLCDRMEEAGFVARQPCGDDGRGIEAALTAHGRAELKRAAPVHLRGVRAHFTSKLDADQARALASALTRIAEAASKPRE
jgi:DNA-binding MarR family transcriptional regulator